MKKNLSVIFLTSVLFFPAVSLALELSYPTINIPGIGDTTLSLEMNLGQLIAWLYYFIIGISGFAAFLMLVWGGVQWLTSAGNPTKMGEARDRIASALLGIVIILASWIILRTIDPNLTMIKMPPLPGTQTCAQLGGGWCDTGKSCTGTNNKTSLAFDANSNSGKSCCAPIATCVTTP